MNIFDIIPGIGTILEKTVTKKGDLEKIKVELRELDVRELEAKMSVQRSWLDNKSVFVAGAIPMILWMVSIVVAFNHIIAPLLAPWLGPLPTLDLPGWYSSLAGTIIIGLFGKKAWDSNTIQFGTFSKPAKGSDQSHETTIAQATEKRGVAEEKTSQKIEGAAPAAKTGKKYDSPEEVDARIAELAAGYGANK